MNLKKAALYGVLIWIFIFIVISIIIFIPALADKLTMQKVLNLTGVAILILIFGNSYFKKYPANFGQGLLVGTVWVIVSTILDLVITVPLFVKPKRESYGDFYSEWDIWVGLGIMILFAGIAAILFSKKESKSITETTEKVEQKSIGEETNKEKNE